MGEIINCREAAERLHEYLKRELTSDTEAAIRDHLERCAPCFKQARFEQNFLLMLERRTRGIGCPGSLRARIVSVLRSEAGDG